MKTRTLLMTLGVAALTTITFNVVASDALLSPRAAGNQVKHISGVSADANLVSVDHYTVIAAPRAASNQITRTAGTNNELNPAMACTKMTASPKMIQACAATPGM